MKTGIIGLGLIGGSMALAIKKHLNAGIYGMDKYHQSKAMDLGLIDEELSVEKISEMDIVIIATPVNTIPEIAWWVLDHINSETLVFDVGSTKHKIAEKINAHPNRKNFVLAHPIAGTEYSGPEAAFLSLFNHKMNIICDVQKTNKSILVKAYDLFNKLKMNTIEMDSAEHDKHIAYVSHLSHISSFMLGKTVLDLEKDDKNIFRMAGSGFASTVRLAKSSPDTWTPIFLENKTPILQSLDEYIDNLNDFKVMLYRENQQKIKETLTKINYIGKIIDRIGKNK
jgi:prephenate dehydrogenase